MREPYPWLQCIWCLHSVGDEQAGDKEQRSPDDPPDAWDDSSVDEIPVDDAGPNPEQFEDQAAPEGEVVDEFSTEEAQAEANPVESVDEEVVNPDEQPAEGNAEAAEPELPPVEPTTGDEPEVNGAEASLVRQQTQLI